MPVRRCIACRRRTGKDQLVRLVVTDGAVGVDALAREPGRGAYLCGRPSCTDIALRRDGAALRRALRLAGGSGTVDGDRLRAAIAALAGRQQISSSPRADHVGPPGVSE